MPSFKCRICGSKEYKTLFHYEMPLAAEVKDEILVSKKYPLDAVICTSCGHVQLKEMVDADLYGDYLYTPSFAKEFHDYVNAFVENLNKKFDTDKDKKVVEIGSSNGFLLKRMQNFGWKTLGFEPSKHLADMAEEVGVSTIADYFNVSNVKKIVEQLGKPDVIILRHVLEHLNDLNEIMQAIRDTLDENGLLIIEVPYLKRIMEEKQFYAFFHEHLSYFSVTALKRLLEPYGFSIVSIYENNLEGGSVLIYADLSHCTDNQAVQNYLRNEEGILSVESVLGFSHDAETKVKEIRDIVSHARAAGDKLAVWGAGQRGCTLCNICGLTNEDIEYAIDVNENYWWKYISGANIQVVPPSFLEENYVDKIIIFATGYAESIIRENQKYIEQGGKFIQIISK